MKRAATIVSALLVLLAACGDRAPLSSVDSGIRGVVVAVPRCPVVTVQDPCPDLPVPGIVARVIASDGCASKTRTDAAGQFKVAVAPGEYVLKPVVDNGGATFAKPLQVTVSDAGFVEVTLHLDTGMK